MLKGYINVLISFNLCITILLQLETIEEAYKKHKFNLTLSYQLLEQTDNNETAKREISGNAQLDDAYLLQEIQFLKNYDLIRNHLKGGVIKTEELIENQVRHDKNCYIIDYRTLLIFIHLYFILIYYKLDEIELNYYDNLQIKVARNHKKRFENLICNVN